MPLARTQGAYESEIVRLAHSALLDVAACLQAYRNAMVLIGGWVPYLLLRRYKLPGNPFTHVGSIDSDWILDPSKIDQDGYDTIVRLLERRGFSQSAENRFRFIKSYRVPRRTRTLEIPVDLLTAVPSIGEGARRRHRRIQKDLEARTTEAAEIALAHNETIEIDGELPGGGYHKFPIHVADVVGCIGTKGLVLRRRFLEKDCYDIYSVVANYGGGPREVASKIQPYKGESSMKRSLANIREWFRSVDGLGPVSVGNFFSNEAGEARERRIRAAFENVDTLLRELKIT